MQQDVLVEPCPICGQSALAGDGSRYHCASCGSQVKQVRWLGVWPRDRFFFEAIGGGYRNLEAGLIGSPLSRAGLARLAGSVYSDEDLAALAAGDLARLRPPSSTLSQVMFPQSREVCYIQANGLARAEGPPLSDGVHKTNAAADRRAVRILDRGNLFVSDQRLIFPSATHITIRLDSKLSGVSTFHDALAVQRKGEAQATYFLGLQPWEVSLITAYLQGRLPHLR